MQKNLLVSLLSLALFVIYLCVPPISGLDIRNSGFSMVPLMQVICGLCRLPLPPWQPAVQLQAQTSPPQTPSPPPHAQQVPAAQEP